jgi:hypothetical protein
MDEIIIKTIANQGDGSNLNIYLNSVQKCIKAFFIVYFTFPGHLVEHFSYLLPCGFIIKLRHL